MLSEFVADLWSICSFKIKCSELCLFPNPTPETQKKKSSTLKNPCQFSVGAPGSSEASASTAKIRIFARAFSFKFFKRVKITV